MTERSRNTAVKAIAVPQSFHQLGVLVLDGSGSMDEMARGNITKAQAVNIAVREMLTRFKASRYVKNFSFAMVTFDEEARTHTPVSSAESIDDYGDYDPLKQHGGGTRFTTGLQEARKIAEAFLQTDHPVPASVVILIMSDGRDGEGGIADPMETRRLADEIAQNPNITLCTTYFAEVGAADQEAQDHLRALASTPETGFKTVYDADTLRTFFVKSMSQTGGVKIV